MVFFETHITMPLLLIWKTRNSYLTKSGGTFEQEIWTPPMSQCQQVSFKDILPVMTLDN